MEVEEEDPQPSPHRLLPAWQKAHKHIRSDGLFSFPPPRGLSVVCRTQGGVETISP